MQFTSYAFILLFLPLFVLGYFLLNKINRYSVKLLVPGHSIRRELVLYKVRARNSEDKNEIIQIANIFRGAIIDVSKETLTLSVIGDEKKTNAVQELLEGFGIVELVRTGMIALERGKYTINEDTKEKGEFNYGKDVL